MNTTILRWIDEQIQNIKHGEISIVFIVHDGEIKRIEKHIISKELIRRSSNG